MRISDWSSDVCSSDLQALLLVEQRQFPLLELLEELVPGNLHQRVVLRLRGVREHEADDAHVAPLVGPLDGGGLATLSFRPFADGLVIRGRLGHDVTSPWSGSTLSTRASPPTFRGIAAGVARPALRRASGVL